MKTGLEAERKVDGLCLRFDRMHILQSERLDKYGSVRKPLQNAKTFGCWCSFFRTSRILFNLFCAETGSRPCRYISQQIAIAADRPCPPLQWQYTWAIVVSSLKLYSSINLIALFNSSKVGSTWSTMGMCNCFMPIFLYFSTGPTYSSWQLITPLTPFLYKSSTWLKK